MDGEGSLVPQFECIGIEYVDFESQNIQIATFVSELWHSASLSCIMSLNISIILHC